MPSRRISIVLAFFVVAFAVACGSGSKAHVTPAPSVAAVAATPTAPATATAPSLRSTPVDTLDATRDAIANAAVFHAPGWIVYLRGNDLYAGDLLTGNEMPLTDGSKGAGFAGAATVGEETWIYYTSVDAISGTPAASEATFGVYRRQLGTDSSTEERLFEFTGGDRYLTDFWANASVSSEGRDIAYTGDDGLRVFDVDSQTDEFVLRNRPSTSRTEPGGGVHGVRYSHPIWAPVGGWLLVTRGENRWPYNAQEEAIRPFDSNTEYPFAHGIFRWSTDGEHLCAGTSSGGLTGIGLVTADSTDAVDFTPNLFDNAILRPSVDSCAVSEDGRLAVGYGTNGVADFMIALLDASGMPVARIDAGAVLPQVDYWLPDDSGFIVQTLKTPSLVPEASVVLLDGTFRRLPFSAERVLGTIPTD